MRYILDTAAWANAALKPEIIPQRILHLLQTPETKGLCSVSLLEAAMHDRHDRLISRPATLDDFFDRALTADIELLELTRAVAAAANQLPRFFTGDPFDRAIAATARVLGLTLITTDREIRAAQFCKVEFFVYRPSRSRS
jgi:PIN domain nuclease of toxin-antitoxin system